MLHGHRGTVVAQHSAKPHQRIVDVADLRLHGLLIAADRADQVALQVARRDGEPLQADAGQAMANAFEGRASRAHHEHPLAVAHERTHRVDDGLGAAGAGQRVDGERMPRGDACEHALLLGIRVEKQCVGGRRALIGARDDRRLAPDRQALAVVMVTGERIEHGLIEVHGIPRHRGADIGERRDDQARMHGERVDRRGQCADVVDHRLGLEHAALVGQCRERLTVQFDAEVRAQGSDELGVHGERAVQLQLEVGMVTTDAERAQQHRCGARQPADAPRREADGEVHRLDAARSAQLDVLRGDPLGGQARVARGDLVAEQIRQESGAPGDELRKASGVGLGDLDAAVVRIVEVQQRRGAAQFCRACAQPVPFGLGDVHHGHSRFRKSEIARGHGRRVVLCADHGAAFSSPHTATLSGVGP